MTNVIINFQPLLTRLQSCFPLPLLLCPHLLPILLLTTIHFFMIFEIQKRSSADRNEFVGVCSWTTERWFVSELKNPVKQGNHSAKNPLSPSTTQWPWEFYLQMSFNKHVTHQREAFILLVRVYVAKLNHKGNISRIKRQHLVGFYHYVDWFQQLGTIAAPLHIFRRFI